MSIAVTLVGVAMLAVVVLLLPESPPHIGLKPYGAVASAPVEARDENPFGVAIAGLRRTANGLINTHLIAYCGDHGIPAVNSATLPR